ncbi:uncharacterized protein UDID_19623 [Ustilago sp. UG-2017a]|nr:uncharacterized protein UDID_19623 [Ustilago sp. UG-2017a]
MVKLMRITDSHRNADFRSDHVQYDAFSDDFQLSSYRGLLHKIVTYSAWRRQHNKDRASSCGAFHRGASPGMKPPQRKHPDRCKFLANPSHQRAHPANCAHILTTCILDHDMQAKDGSRHDGNANAVSYFSKCSLWQSADGPIFDDT